LVTKYSAYHGEEEEGDLNTTVSGVYKSKFISNFQNRIAGNDPNVSFYMERASTN
jgi:hypothetical protein